jgi:hypothetical protein
VSIPQKASSKRAAVSSQLVMFRSPIQSDLSGSLAGQRGEGSLNIEDRFARLYS